MACSDFVAAGFGGCRVIEMRARDRGYLVQQAIDALFEGMFEEIVGVLGGGSRLKDRMAGAADDVASDVIDWNFKITTTGRAGTVESSSGWLVSLLCP